MPSLEGLRLNLSELKFWDKKNTFGQKYFLLNNFFGSKKIGVGKIFLVKIFWVEKIFWLKKN